MFDDAAHDLDAYKRAAERLCALLPSELSETIAAVAWCSVCPCSLSVIACAHHRSDRAPRKGSVTAYRVQSLRSPLRLSHCVCTACAPGALFVTLHVIASGSVTAWIRAGTRRGTPPTRGGGSTYLQRATSENLARGRHERESRVCGRAVLLPSCRSDLQAGAQCISLR